jgi:hypothetical protein
MLWKKLKKVIFPLIIVKLVILAFFIFRSETFSISRDINYSGNYQEVYDNDSIVIKKQKFIRIVRNGDQRRIQIILRGRKNSKPLKEEDKEEHLPMID